MGDKLTRAEFDGLEADQRRKFIMGGGSVTDATIEKVADPEVLTRKEFDALSPEERLTEIRSGRQVVNGERALTND